MLTFGLAALLLATSLLLLLAGGTIRELRANLAATRKSLRQLELHNNELRQQLNHICEHRACRLARRIGLT